MTQDVFQEAFERVGRNDLILLTIGDMTERSLLMRYGLPRDDAAGQPIDHPINRRAIALPLEALRKVPNVVFASGGANKTHAIAAVLRSGLGSALVCDEATARGGDGDCAGGGVRSG